MFSSVVVISRYVILESETGTCNCPNSLTVGAKEEALNLRPMKEKKQEDKLLKSTMNLKRAFCG